MTIQHRTPATGMAKDKGLRFGSIVSMIAHFI